MRNLSLLFLGLLMSLPVYADNPAPRFGFGSELGLNRSWDDTLNAVLEGQGLVTVSDTDLWSVGWRTSFGADSWIVEVASTRLSNTTWGFASTSERTRFIADSATLGAGGDWEPLKGFRVILTTGLTVDRLLLQTYSGNLSTIDDVWAATKQASLISDWAFSPEASARLVWRFWTYPNQPYGFAVWVGASAGYRLGTVTWKVNGDEAVSGLGAPWTTWVRPFVGVGLQ